MQVKIKRLHPDAVIPKYAKNGDAGLDLTAISRKVINSDSGWYYEYDTGLAIEIPEGYVGLLFPRSSQSNVNQLLTNHVGIIDSGFRGPIRVRFKEIISGTNGMGLKTYQYNDRIGQLIILPYPKIELIEVDELTETERGSTGFGSTGS